MNLRNHLREWWAKHPDNSDNWDLPRWRIEKERFLALGTLYGIVVSSLFLLSSFYPPIFPPFPAVITFTLLIMGLWIAGLGFIYYPRKIRQLEEAA